MCYLKLISILHSERVLQHKAFLVEWMMDNIENVAIAVAFLGTDITEEIYKTFYCNTPF